MNREGNLTMQLRIPVDVMTAFCAGKNESFLVQ